MSRYSAWRKLAEMHSNKCTGITANATEILALALKTACDLLDQRDLLILEADAEIRKVMPHLESLDDAHALGQWLTKVCKL